MRTGITGHQNLGPSENIDRVVAAMNSLVEQCGVTEGFTSLARGADQLYAKILCQRSVPYTVVIPCANYASLFTSTFDRNCFEELLEAASQTITLPFPEPSELAFYGAGKKIVEMSEMIIAAWDGKPAKGLGGTGDIVEYALKKGRKVMHIYPDTGEVREI